MPNRLQEPVLVASGLLAAAAFLAFDLFVVGRPAFPLDDTWIHLQFARRLAEGDGLAYATNGWVTGSTAPLWSALLAVGFLLPGGLPLLWPELLAGLAFAVALPGVLRLGKELGLGGRMSFVAAVLVLATPRLLWSAGSGMEICLFLCLAVWGMALHAREVRRLESVPLGCALLAVSVLCRPEGALLLLLALGERLLRRTPGTGVATLAAALAVGPTLLFYRLAGGSFLPTTFWVKAGGPRDPWPDVGYLRIVLDVFLRSQPILVLFAGAGILAFAYRAGHIPAGRSRTGHSSWVPAAWLLGQVFAYSVLASRDAPPPVGNFGRYHFPLLPLVVIFGLLAIQATVSGPPSAESRGSVRWPTGLLLASILAVQLFAAARMPASYLQNVLDVEGSDVRAAAWLAPRLPPDALLAVQDVGALGFFLPNPLVDLAGIVSPEVQPILRGEGDLYWEEALARHLRGAGADLLVVFEGSYPALVRAPGFDEVKRFSIPDNHTMAGTELLVVRTPWSRIPAGKLSDDRATQTPRGPLR